MLPNAIKYYDLKMLPVKTFGCFVWTLVCDILIIKSIDIFIRDSENYFNGILFFILDFIGDSFLWLY